MPLSKEKQKRNLLILGLIVLWVMLIFGVTIVKMAMQ